MRDNVARIFNVCGALAPLLFVVTFVVSGLFHAEYSHYRQYISELGERGSSTEVLMRYGVYYLPGVMFLAFGLLLVAKFRHSKVAIIAGLLVIVSGIARINGGNFPCDPGCMPVNPPFSQKMHNLSAGLATFPLACSAIFWGFASRKLLGS